MFISSTKCSFHSEVEEVRLTVLSFSLLKWAIPETEVKFVQFKDYVERDDNRILDTEYGIMYTGYRILDTGYWKQNTEY